MPTRSKSAAAASRPSAPQVREARGAYKARRRSADGSWGALPVHEVMGKLIDLGVSSEADVLHLQRAGLPSGALQELMRHLPANDASVIISRSSLRRRMAEGVLSEAESERALRVARVLARAIQLFGDAQRAQDWLAHPAAYVEGGPAESPLALCAYEAGAKIVEEQLLQVEYGVF